MDIRVVEKYLIRACLAPIKPSFTMETHFLYTALLPLLISAAAFLFGGYLLVVHEQTIDIAHYALIVLLPILITIILSIRQMKKIVESLVLEDLQTPINTVEFKKWASIGGNLGIVLILIFSFIRRQNPSLESVILMILMLVLGIAMIDIAISRLYMLHLLKKYCPYLKTPADARYQKTEDEHD